MNKQNIRKNISQILDKLDDSTHMLFSRNIHNHILETKDYDRCKCIFTYLSFGKEVDTFNLVNQALLDGKHVFVPKVNGKTMEFYHITSLKGLIRSKFGILEPDEELHISYPNWSCNLSIESNHFEKLMILPGIAFDLKGHRIGYGAGYYDKYLAEYKKEDFNKIALAFDFQILDQIPAEEHDINAEKIITPTRIIQVDV